MKKFCFVSALCLLCQPSFAQWDQYYAQWEGFPGSMLVNMQIKGQSPVPQLPYLLEVDQDILDCTENGFPRSQENARIEKRAMELDSVLSADRYVINVGRHLYQCRARDYFYVEDTSQIMSILAALQLTGKVVKDKAWKVYHEFIYPDDYLIQTMVNGKTIQELVAEGIVRDEKSLLTHFASFASVDDRNQYRRFLIEQNFKVDRLDDNQDDARPYRIVFTRNDFLNTERLSNITLRLVQKAESLNGSYGGWETEVQ